MKALYPEQVAERFRTALALYELSEQMLRQKVRRQLSEAREEEVEAAVVEWLHRRPGAEFGDAEGRPVSWRRRG